MGLFDNYYDPQTYSDNNGGGLIDRLLAQLQGQSQYQPGAGFPGAQPPAPMNSNAQMQNDPIAVGNYQMPRIGGGFPDDVEPAPRSPMQANAQMQPQAMQQPSAQPAFMQSQQPAQTTGGRLANSFQSWANTPVGNPMAALANGFSSLATGQRTDPTGVSNQIMQAKYKALLDSGMPESKALLATISPELEKTIGTQTFGPKPLTPLGEGYVADNSGNVKRAYEPSDKNKIVKIRQDGLGREQYAVFNPADGSYKPVAAPGDNSSGGLGNMDLTGKEYLASMPKSEANIVQMMAEGTQAPPSSFALGKQLWVNRIAAAKNYDPTFDGTNWSGRVAGVKDFSAGKSSEMVRSANQTLHHTGALLDSIDALNNGNYPLINRAGNAINEATGGGAPTAFRLNAHAVSEEMSKVFKGANLSDTEIKAWEQNLHENMSPEQQRAAVGKLKELLQGSLDALEEKRLNSMGPMAAAKAGPLIKEEGQRVLQRIDDWLKKGTGAAQGTSPAQTKTGVSWSVVQ